MPDETMTAHDAEGHVGSTDAVGRLAPERHDFRALIDAHRQAGTCYICGQLVDASQGYHGATGAHWDCTKAEDRKTEEVFAKVERGLRSIGIKPKRRREGEGATAQKAKALAVAALEESLGVRIVDVTVWNQQGAYRGPQWDLDAWGLHFWFERDGHRFSGSASSLATMTDCIKYKRLRAIHEGATGFTLWAHQEPPNTGVER